MAVTSSNGKMSRQDREELRRVVNERAKLAGQVIEARKAELLANFEQQLASIYKIDDAAWREVTAAAQGAVHAANEAIAEACRERGIPEEWGPGLSLMWIGRGENGAVARRQELRKVAVTRLDAAGKQAKVKIEHAALERREKLALDALETAEAQRFIESMPTVQELLPPLDVKELETTVPIKRVGVDEW